MFVNEILYGCFVGALSWRQTFCLSSNYHSENTQKHLECFSSEAIAQNLRFTPLSQELWVKRLPSHKRRKPCREKNRKRNVSLFSQLLSFRCAFTLTDYFSIAVVWISGKTLGRCLRWEVTHLCWSRKRIAFLLAAVRVGLILSYFALLPFNKLAISSHPKERNVLAWFSRTCKFWALQNVSLN